MTQKEYKRLKEKHSQLLIDQQDMKTSKEKFELEFRLLSEKQLESEHTSKKQRNAWEREKRDLEA